MDYAIIGLTEGGDEAVTGVRSFAEALADDQIKTLPNGRKAARPIADAIPELGDGEALGLPDFSVGETTVTRTFPVVAAPPPERRSVRKLLVVDRIIATGAAEAALKGFAANPIAKLRFDAASDLWADDADVAAFLTAIGLDAEQIMAPE